MILTENNIYTYEGANALIKPFTKRKGKPEIIKLPALKSGKYYDRKGFEPYIAEMQSAVDKEVEAYKEDFECDKREIRNLINGNSTDECHVIALRKHGVDGNGLTFYRTKDREPTEIEKIYSSLFLVSVKKGNEECIVTFERFKAKVN